MNVFSCSQRLTKSIAYILIRVFFEYGHVKPETKRLPTIYLYKVRDRALHGPGLDAS